MSESTSPQTPICRIDPCEHALLKEHVRKLTTEGGLMAQVIEHVKGSNELARHNNKWLRGVAGLFVVCLTLVFGVLLVVAKTMSDVKVVGQRLNIAVTNIEALADRLSTTERKLQQVKESTDKADVDRESQPRIELVAERDPNKARAAPIRVRITPPAFLPESSGSSPVPTQSAVEVPLPVKDVVRVLPDSGARG